MRRERGQKLDFCRGEATGRSAVSDERSAGNAAPVQLRLALSRLLAARGQFEPAIAEATEACQRAPASLAHHPASP